MGRRRYNRKKWTFIKLTLIIGTNITSYNCCSASWNWCLDLQYALSFYPSFLMPSLGEMEGGKENQFYFNFMRKMLNERKMWWSETSVFSTLLTQKVWLCDPWTDPRKGCSSLPPTFTFCEGGRKFQAGRANALGGLASSVRQQPCSPPSPNVTPPQLSLTLVPLSPRSLSFQTQVCPLIPAAFARQVSRSTFCLPAPGLKTGHWSWGEQSPEVTQIASRFPPPEFQVWCCHD